MREAHEYSSQALKLGEEIGSYPIIGLAYAILTWTCAELKLLDRVFNTALRREDCPELQIGAHDIFSIPKRHGNDLFIQGQ